MTTSTTEGSDPRYVQDVVAWIWPKLLARKRQTLPYSLTHLQRKLALDGLYEPLSPA